MKIVMVKLILQEERRKNTTKKQKTKQKKKHNKKCQVHEPQKVQSFGKSSGVIP
jgi:hypothetical protein